MRNKISMLDKNSVQTIKQLADWYFDEWGVPKETTTQRLCTQSPDDILFHLILQQDNQIIATGGIHLKVGIIKVHEEFKQYSPWVSMIYVDKAFRNLSLGQIILMEIERMAKEEFGFAILYLYTNSAERLYLRNGWTSIHKVMYKEKETVVMKKEI